VGTSLLKVVEGFVREEEAKDAPRTTLTAADEKPMNTT
jgi:hypothetical protein